MARRDQTPPYEIMRSRGTAAPKPEAAEPAVQGDLADEEERINVPRKAPWWVGSSAPLVLRLPRGLAVLSVFTVLMVIVLSYWVGSMRGAAAAKPDPEATAIGDRFGPSDYYEYKELPYDGPVVEVPEKRMYKEVRKDGYWYLRLMTSSEEECRKLASFLHKRDVAVLLVVNEAKQNCVVYAVDRGYRSGDLSSESAKRYMALMRNHGQAWKESNGGRGDKLSSMYYAQYEKPD